MNLECSLTLGHNQAYKNVTPWIKLWSLPGFGKLAVEIECVFWEEDDLKRGTKIIEVRFGFLKQKN